MIHGKRSKISETGVWKKLTPTLKEDIAEFRTSAEDIPAVVVETAREPETEVEPEGKTELPPSHKTIQ